MFIENSCHVPLRSNPVQYDIIQPNKILSFWAQTCTIMIFLERHRCHAL